MNALDAAFEVLREASEPLHVRTLTHRMLAHELWVTAGKTPWSTISRDIQSDIKKRGNDSRFQQVGPATFAVREFEK